MARYLVPDFFFGLSLREKPKTYSLEVAVMEVCRLAIGKRLLRVEMRRGLMKVINPVFKTKFGFYVYYLRYSVAMYFLKETAHCALAWWFCLASHL